MQRCCPWLLHGSSHKPCGWKLSLTHICLSSLLGTSETVSRQTCPLHSQEGPHSLPLTQRPPLPRPHAHGPDTAEVKWLKVVACPHPRPACSGIPRHLFPPCLSRLWESCGIAVLGDAGDREEPHWLSVPSCPEQVPGAQEPPSRPGEPLLTASRETRPRASVHPSSW